MPVFIALLRGINVSGQRKVPMAELRNLLRDAGFHGVQTYIQSGNVILSNKTTNHRQLETRLGEIIRNHFGFEVAVLILSLEELQRIISQNPYQEFQERLQSKLYFAFLFSKPQAERAIGLQQEIFTNESCAISERCVYLLCHKGMGKAKLNNNLIESRLKVGATTRNLRTTIKLLELAKEVARDSPE